jgi:EAL domain-containing protein (putative c-di-GMP-specific phosphodiesterase class I)
VVRAAHDVRRDRRLPARARRGWSLPPRVPEQWLSPAWPLALALAVAACLAGPVLALPGRTVLTPRALPLVVALGAAAAVVAAYGLVVQALVLSEARLHFAAWGFALSAVAFLGRAVAVRYDQHRVYVAAEVAGALALPVGTLLARLAWRDVRMLAVPTAVLGAAAGLALLSADERYLLAVAAVAGAVALARWPHEQRPAEAGPTWFLVGVGLALTALVAAVRAAHPVAATPGTLFVDALPLIVPGVALGALALGRYHQQVRRWRRLEEAARGLRTRTALLPGRSITPDDDEGLPDEAAVRHLVSGSAGLALQPVRDMRTGLVVGQEALARFGGREPTDRWFRAAVVHGMNARLERLALAAAMAQLAVLEPGQFLAVNVSPLALEDPEVRGLFVSHDLHGVLVEITEHDAVSDYDELRTTLHALRDRGARIAVDDAGAGFSSLRHLLLLQPDIIKLDIALTRHANDPRHAALIRALVSFARHVGVDVLAEGVEVRDQVPTLVDLGVTLGQGWHLGVPVLVVPPADPMGPRT